MKKLIIDIDDKTYKGVKQFYDNMSENECIGEYELAIAEGIPLEEKIGHCKDCDKWKAGRFRDGLPCYSDEGYCTNWHTMTGEKFYCGDFEGKENK